MLIVLLLNFPEHRSCDSVASLRYMFWEIRVPGTFLIFCRINVPGFPENYHMSHNILCYVLQQSEANKFISQ